MFDGTLSAYSLNVLDELQTSCPELWQCYREIGQSLLWHIEENKVLKANLDGWHTAANEQGKRADAAIAANRAEFEGHKLTARDFRQLIADSRRLCKEVRGMVGIIGDQMREHAGNTNVACLMNAVENVEANFVVSGRDR